MAFNADAFHRKIQSVVKKHQDAMRRDLDALISKEAGHEKLTQLVESIVQLSGPAQTMHVKTKTQGSQKVPKRGRNRS
jgi:hypothetical protein